DVTGRSARWPAHFTVVLLLCAAVFISYIDRTNVSVGAIAMQAQFGWTETYRPYLRQVASTKPRSQRCAGSASKRGCHICETVIASVRTGSGKLLITAGPDLA